MQAKETANVKAASLQKLTLNNDGLPLRLSYGTDGTPTILRTNYIVLQATRKQVIHRYKVAMWRLDCIGIGKLGSLQDLTQHKRRRKFEIVLQKLFKNRPGVVTDFADILLGNDIIGEVREGQSRTDQIDYFENEEAKSGPANAPETRKYGISVTYDTALQVSDLTDHLGSTPLQASSLVNKAEIVQALNIITTFAANSSSTTSGGVARSKFFEWDANKGPGLRAHASLGGGLMVSRGFYQSVRTSTDRLLAIVRGCASVFYSDVNLADIMSEFHFVEGYTDARLEAFLAGVKISTRYFTANNGGVPIARTKIIKGLAHAPLAGDSQNVKFYWKDHTPPKFVSIADYFHERKFRRTCAFRCHHD